MDNLVLAVTITIGLILAGTHTTTAQCEFTEELSIAIYADAFLYYKFNTQFFLSFLD